MAVDTLAPATEAGSSTLGDINTGTWGVLKGRIKDHYDLLSEYYYSLWGEHIHHGYFTSPSDTKELAQRRLIDLLLSRSKLPPSSRVLDVGCGVGGTSRYLAVNQSCTVTGITISSEQVKIAQRLSHDEATKLRTLAKTPADPSNLDESSSGAALETKDGFIPLKDGKVRFKELDAEKMGEYFDNSDSSKRADFDAVWISEAMSHLPNKQLFFENAFKLLKVDGEGRLVVADWFKDEGLTEQQMSDDIKPIEDGMLLPPLCTMSEYVAYAEKAGFKVLAEPFDISDNVKKTWDISLSLIQNPSLWALAFTQGRDIIAFLRAFQAMRRGFGNGSFRYAVIVFEKG